MLEQDLVKRIKEIQLKAKSLVTDLLSGEYHSAFKGQGISFAEVREYIPGDDIRSIDWNVTARMNVPFIKEFQEERELTLFILLDLSSSQNFGSSERLKSEIATEIAAVFSYLSLKNNDKVGLILFTDKVEKYIPPKKGRTNIWKIIQQILTFSPVNKKTDISVALDFLLRVTSKKAIVLLISDFIFSDYQQKIKIASRKHDLIAVRISDLREKNIPSVGLINLEDSESGEKFLLDTYNKFFTKNFSGQIAQEEKKMKDFFKSAKIDYLEIDTQTSYINTLLAFFRRREKSLLK